MKSYYFVMKHLVLNERQTNALIYFKLKGETKSSVYVFPIRK
jgi:hypothetical protein